MLYCPNLSISSETPPDELSSVSAAPVADPQSERQSVESNLEINYHPSSVVFRDYFSTEMQ